MQVFPSKTEKLIAVLLLIFCSGAARCATITFQGTPYTVSSVTLATTVPAITTNDLIFVQVADGPKVLAIPTDPTLRGSYDVLKNTFYVLNRTTGEIDGWSSINATLVNMDGTLYNTVAQIPAAGSPPVEVISKPLSISETGADVCIINTQLMGYRTDGPLTTDEKIYSIARTTVSTVGGNITTQTPISVPPAVPISLKNADFANKNLSVFVEYDSGHLTFLTSQISLDPSVNSVTTDRISAFRTDGTIADEIILTGNSAIPYTGGELGLTIDPGTGTIYLLAANSRSIIIFTPLVPSLTSVKPVTGSINGGDTVTLTGVVFPPDATVYFDGIPAASINVISSTTIQATTPPHAPGSVNITILGTGISSDQPITLQNGYKYVNSPPVAVLTATPTQGLPPLQVTFDSSGSTDRDGSIASRVIDYGDGTIFTLPANTTQTTHTYQNKGTFVARLTVTDNYGATNSATQVIVVGGSADLVLHGLQFKLLSNSANDSVKLDAELVLPDGTDLTGATLSVGFINPLHGSLAEEPATGGFSPANSVGGASSGGQFAATLSKAGKANYQNLLKVSLTPQKKPGFAPNTQEVSFIGKADLTAALNAAVVNLKFDQNGVELTNSAKAKQRIGEVVVALRLDTAAGDTLQYNHLGVLAISPGRNTSLTLSK